MDDADTRDVHGNVDASSITLRVKGLTGGTLQRRPASDSDTWITINPSGSAPNESWAFTLADLKAGKVSLVAGDGVAQSKGGTGKKIVFRVQAGDGTHLSDSDPNDGQSDDDPVDVEILIRSSAEIFAGSSGLLNADGVLTPDGATLTSWKQDATTHGGVLHVIVKLVRHQAGDALSLRSGYRARKITTLVWDGSQGELLVGFADDTTIPEMKTALELLELKTGFSTSASTRKVWIFPILSGTSGFGYRVDETAGLVRYYSYDSTSRSFADATTAAAGRSLFGKHGYLGAPTSSPEKSIYKKILPPYSSVFLAISDDRSVGTTEGKWVITAGPRKGQLFWDHTTKKYGPGAEGSGWSDRTHFWGGDADPNGGTRENYARYDRERESVYDESHRSLGSVGHHDLRLQAGDIFFVRWTCGSRPPTRSWRSISARFEQPCSVL